MANETTTTTLDDLIQAIILEARMVMSQGADLRQVVTTRPLPRGKGSATFPLYGAMTAAAVAEGTDLTNQAVSTTGPEITPTEQGLMTTLTDIADWKSQPLQVGTDIGALMGEALRDLRNQTIWALFDGFTTSIGSSNSNITEALVLQAVAQLMANKAPKPYFMPITPFVFEDLAILYATNTSQTAESIRNAVLNNGILPPIFGVIPLVVDNLVAGTGTGELSAPDAKCAVLSAKALGYVPGFDVKIETDRDISLRATEIVGTTFEGFGEIKDDYGIELLVDNKD